MLALVEIKKANPLGTGARRIAVTSRKTSDDKTPWSDQPPINTVVERTFVRKVHLGESPLPYRLPDPRHAVIPVRPTQHKLLASNQIAEYEGLSKWREEVERIWSANKSKSDSGSFLDRIDSHAQLISQIPGASHRVVYTKSVNSLTAARIDDPDIVIDQLLHWGPQAP